MRATTLALAIIYIIAALAIGAPMSSSVYSEYIYNYEANIVTLNEGITSPTGFKFTAKAHLELVYKDPLPTSDTETSAGQIYRLRLTEPSFYPLISQTGNSFSMSDYKFSKNSIAINIKHNKFYNPEHDIYAHVVTLANGTAYIKQLYTHSQDVATFKNLKKSILINLLPTNHHLQSISSSSSAQEHTHDRFNEIITDSENAQDSIFKHKIDGSGAVCDDNNKHQPELFSPDSLSQVKIIAKPMRSSASSQSTTQTAPERSIGPKLLQTVEGYQNVTFRSRVFNQAQSNITTTFQLDLTDEIDSKAHEPFDNVDSISNAFELLDKKIYILDTIDMQRVPRICSQHHCGQKLAQLYEDYKEDLTDKMLASVDAPIAHLRLMDTLRGSETTMNDIIDVLKRMKGKYDIQSSFLDILAAARTKDSIMAALKHLRLPKNNDLDTAERFLSVLSVATKTASKMHLKRPILSPYYFTPTPALKLSQLAKNQRAQMASSEFISQEFLEILKKTPAKKWASQKLRWSTLLTLATLVNARNIQLNMFDSKDVLNKEVSKLLFNELKSCPEADTDCRIVVLQAIGNIGLLDQTEFEILKDHILHSGKRESIASMKVLRDLLQTYAGEHLSLSFYTNLKDLLIRIVYDHTKETTVRILAAEMIVKFIPDSLASEQLLLNLPSFGNNELATMIYSRMLSLRPEAITSAHHENWYWKSCIINGTSASFIRQMAKTDSLNASYGVNVELLNRGKLLKESSFDVFLDTNQRTQDLFSLGIFARGLQSFAGGSTEGESGAEEEGESAMVGMTLRLLGGYLRPYVFFNGMSELLSHVWSGTASEPTTAFNGNLLLIDHEEGYPLISGFVSEQVMRGVLSIDVTGSIKISLWHRNSHSVVTTKASIIVHASQGVFTDYDNFWNTHLFSFGGEALVDFVADSDFHSTPFKICLQVTQPEFRVRYNSRRHDQLMTNKVRRKISRKNYLIDAKSYSLNAENNKMCSIMNDEL